MSNKFYDDGPDIVQPPTILEINEQHLKGYQTAEGDGEAKPPTRPDIYTKED